MMRDLGFAMKPVLNIDAKATDHILHRQGVGKLKRIEVAYLWVQDEIRSQRLCTESGAKKMSQTWDFGSAFRSQRHAAGDHVQASASRNVQQQEQM